METGIIIVLWILFRAILSSQGDQDIVEIEVEEMGWTPHPAEFALRIND